MALGCRSTRRLTKDQALVTKLTVNGVNDQFAEQAASYISLDIRPNSRFPLWVYNTFNKKGNKKLGEPPHLLDSALVEVSRNQIEKFLNNKGYLNAKVKDSVSIKNKRASIIYTANPGIEFKFRNVTYEIPDSSIKSLYLSKRQNFTKITPGKRYDTDSLGYEREQIYSLMKKNGYFDFVRQYVRETIDTNFNSAAADVEIEILNPFDGSLHKVYHIEDTYVRIQPSSGTILKENLPDTAVVDSQYYFYDYSHFFKPKRIANYLFIKKGDKYSIENSNLTTQRLFDLNVFKGVNVDYRKANDSSAVLKGIIDIIPLKKKTNRLDGEYTFNSSITGINLGLTYQNRNFLGGAELLEVKASGGLQFDKNIKGSLSNRLLSRDYQFGVSLSFPRLIAPINLPNLGKNGVPHTRIGTSYQIYKLTDKYSRRSFGTNLTYDWVETKYKLHSFTPISIQYAKGQVNPNLVDNLRNNGNAFFLLTLNSQLISSSSYNYTYNLARLNNLEKFTFFSGNIELGGNTASLLGGISKKTDTTGAKLIFGVPYYQFVKLETDVRFYKFFGGNKQFIARFNPGIGYAYGNVKSLPFDKLFFGGGSTGIRAWQARTLGPGNYNRSSLGSDSARTNLRNLDQLGDLKFQANLEYRFKLLDNIFGAKLKGATFVDFGNIWNLSNKGFPGSQIKLNQLWNQTAVGTGFGLRFDVSFFVFRLDYGLKFKDPQFTGSDQYVYKYWFNSSARKSFQAKYLTTNGPEKYSLSQIQFGIGMPF
ncbi:MAG: BamA/TamA family outer membrane protein [Bacteroidetes bacterium]|nr:BamA/TamA family outer membrane protein [Bacteroidota bacterium]MBU1484516.1 BamA/TamA family outer membrane protein [Bacteroidota bacterium]MBU1761945.1 BamA/TamA family outer membrane protein [Bacteroidota bacterium]MBU2268569.1 BamA/TamA family outer membrane protein [Bacteroidota bacterium]MBU2375334.1 BamA/TamA family outer membrane protein [Bacteroidota bacterium]